MIKVRRECAVCVAVSRAVDRKTANLEVFFCLCELFVSYSCFHEDANTDGFRRSFCINIYFVYTYFKIHLLSHP